MVATTTLLTILITLILLLAVSNILLWINLKASQECIGYLHDSIDSLAKTMFKMSVNFKKLVADISEEKTKATTD